MLSLYQRLILGFLLLVALVGGLGMLVRHSFVHLSALDAQQQSADAAVGSLSQVQASIAREQVLAGHLASAPDKNLYEQLQAEAQVTDQRMTVAAEVLSPSGKFASIQPLTAKARGNHREAPLQRAHAGDLAASGGRHTAPAARRDRRGHLR